MSLGFNDFEEMSQFIGLQLSRHVVNPTFIKLFSLISAYQLSANLFTHDSTKICFFVP